MPIALLGFLNMFSGLPAFLAANWKYVLVAVLALGLVFTTHEWQHTSALLKTEKAAHAADVLAVKTASTQAQAKIAAEKAAIVQQNTEKANEADAAYASLLATYHSNLLRSEAASGVRSGPSGGQSANSAQGPNGSGASPVLPSITSALTISADDANICAVNTARLQTAHDWAMQLGTTDGKDVNPTPQAK